MTKTPSIKALAALVVHVKSYVPRKDASDAKDYISPFDGSETPTVDLTVGWNAQTGEWSWQSGDNSFTGGAYGYPIWAVTSVTKMDNSRDVARYLIDQLREQEQ